MAFEKWRASRDEEEWRRRERLREDEERERRWARDEYDRPRWYEPRGERDRERESHPGEWRRDDSWAERESERFRSRERGGYPSRGARELGEESYAGKGPTRYRRSDERIYEDVNDRLTEHPGIDASDVEVVVQNCVVVLKGSVRTRDQKRMAEDIAEFTSGVIDVRNELRVGPPLDASQGIPLEERSASAREEGALERSPQATRPRDARDDYGVARREELREGDAEGLEGGPASEPRVMAGMVVVDQQGERIGEVKETHSDVFHLDRPMRRDLYVPYDAVREIREHQVTLRFHSDELDKLNWAVPDLIGMGGRRRH